MELSKAQVRRILKALDKLSVHVESAIDSEIVPGTNDAMPGRKRLLASLRREWRGVEDLKILLERGDYSRADFVRRKAV